MGILFRVVQFGRPFLVLEIHLQSTTWSVHLWLEIGQLLKLALELAGEMSSGTETASQGINKSEEERQWERC